MKYCFLLFVCTCSKDLIKLVTFLFSCFFIISGQLYVGCQLYMGFFLLKDCVMPFQEYTNGYLILLENALYKMSHHFLQFQNWVYLVCLDCILQGDLPHLTSSTIQHVQLLRSRYFLLKSVLYKQNNGILLNFPLEYIIN